MLAIAGGVGAALAWTATTLVAARASRLVDPWSLLATVMTVGLVVALPAALASGIPTIDGRSAGWLAVSGTGNVVGLLFAYAALRIGKVGVVAPISSTEGAIAAVIAVAAGERLGAATGLTLAVIAVGVALAAAAEGDERARRNDLRAAGLACCAALSFGFSLYATGRVGQDLGIAWAALPPRVVGVVALAVPLALSRRWRLRREVLPYAVVGGVGEVAGFALYAFGARHGLAVSAVLGSQFAALSAIAGYVVWRERPARIQVVGVVTILAGVTALGILRA